MLTLCQNRDKIATIVLEQSDILFFIVIAIKHL